MENTQNTAKTKRPYHRLSPEERVVRDAAIAKHKEEVAARKAARAEKKALAKQQFDARRAVTLDVKALDTAFSALVSSPSSDVKSIRAKIDQLITAVHNIDKTLHHRSKSTVVTIAK